MLYLLDYSTIVEMGPNRIINLYDYVHYLLVLSNFSQIPKHEHGSRFRHSQL